MTEKVIEEDIGEVGGVKQIRRYVKGKLLGKGGFAKCFELTNLDENKMLAAKIIYKTSLKKKRAK